MKWWKIVLLCVASIVLLSLGWLRATGLTLLVALVPMLLISESFRTKRRSSWSVFGIGFVLFGAWAGVTAWWIWYAAAVGAIAAVIIQGFLCGGAFALYHNVSKRAPRAAAYTILICGWICAEFIYLNGQLSFPWLMLGNGFANDVWAVQWYEATGVFGGTLWVLLSNVLIFELIRHRTKAKIIWVKLVVLIPVIVSLLIFNFYKFPDKGDVKVTVIQPNLDPYTEKYDVPREIQDELAFSLARNAPSDVDFIAVPETFFENSIDEDNLLASPSIKGIKDLITDEYPSAQFIAGVMTIKFYDNRQTETARNDWGEWYDVFNTALAIDTTAIIGVNHKSKLVVGVETMPTWRILRPLESLILDMGGTTGSLGMDRVQHTFNHNGVITAAPICYESVYGEHFANFVNPKVDGGGANLMFIITNDGWWRDTEGYRQHFSFARLRAIETRRAIARSANTGISGFISPRGDVLQKLGWDIRGTLTETLPLNDTITLYVRWGDYIGRIGSLIFLLGLGYAITLRFKKKI